MSSIYDRSLHSPRGEVSLSAFAFLFSEIVQYSQSRVESVAELMSRLEELGYSIGQKSIEFLAARERLTRREIRLVNMLQFISTTFWKFLFNRSADNLERSIDSEDEFMLYDNHPITNSFISVPADMGQLDCAALVAGMIAGVLDGARFGARVTAHPLLDEVSRSNRTVYLVKFSTEVMERERRLGGARET